MPDWPDHLPTWRSKLCLADPTGLPLLVSFRRADPKVGTASGPKLRSLAKWSQRDDSALVPVVCIRFAVPKDCRAVLAVRTAHLAEARQLPVRRLAEAARRLDVAVQRSPCAEALGFRGPPSDESPGSSREQGLHAPSAPLPGKPDGVVDWRSGLHPADGAFRASSVSEDDNVGEDGSQPEEFS